MAHAAPDTVIGDGRSAPPAAHGVFDGPPAYARDRLDAAAPIRRTRLRGATSGWPARRDGLVYQSMARRAVRTDSRQREYAIHRRARSKSTRLDARRSGWAPPALWRRDDAVLVAPIRADSRRRNLRGFYYHDTPGWQFYDRATGIGVLTLPVHSAFRRGNPRLRSAFSCTGPMRRPTCASPMPPRSGLADEGP